MLNKGRFAQLVPGLLHLVAQQRSTDPILSGGLLLERFCQPLVCLPPRAPRCGLVCVGRSMLFTGSDPYEGTTRLAA